MSAGRGLPEVLVLAHDATPLERRQMVEYRVLVVDLEDHRTTGTT